MSLNYIRLSQQEKDQLVKLKRKTGIKNWNTLCRWAFCVSLVEPSNPPDADIPLDSSVEMTWKVFGGDYRDIYEALSKHPDGRNPQRFFRLHLNRGIALLATNRSIRSIEDLVKIIARSHE